MSTPKAVGIETEYGAVLFGETSTDRDAAARLLLDACTKSDIPWVPSLFPVSPNALETATLSSRSGRDVFLGTGARLYIDHGHPEYSAPECISPRLLVAADKAGERLLAACQHDVNTQMLSTQGQQLLLYKNNSDYKDNSYGCHENYLVSCEFYENLLYYKNHQVFSYLLPFLITRTLLSGAGKVGSEHRTMSTGYQLSQRADFYERLVGLQTMSQRPLFNTRDEPHADQQRFRRLHTIIGDANLAEFSTYLKVGTTQLVLHMLEDGMFKHVLTLADPLAAMRAVSRDLSFRELLQLEDGRCMTALEIQSIYLEQALIYLEQVGGNEEQHAVCHEWEAVLAQLPDAWENLATRLDWAIKRRLFEQALAIWQTSWEEIATWQPVFSRGTDEQQAHMVANQLGLPWQHYEQQQRAYFGLRSLELQYHDIRFDPNQSETGLFYRLQQRGVIERLLTDKEIQALCTQPPPDTRSWLRGQCIIRFSRKMRSADWEQLHFALPHEQGTREYVLDLPNPLEGTESQMSSLWASLESPIQLFEQTPGVLIGKEPESDV